MIMERNGNLRGVLTLVDAADAGEHPIAKDLGALGAHAYLIREGIGRDCAGVSGLAAWAINAAAAARDVAPADAARSAKQALRRLDGRKTIRDQRAILLDGLVLSSTPGRESRTYIDTEIRGDAGSRVCVVEVGTDPRCWDDAVMNIATVLEQLL